MILEVDTAGLRAGDVLLGRVVGIGPSSVIHWWPVPGKVTAPAKLDRGYWTVPMGPPGGDGSWPDAGYRFRIERPDAVLVTMQPVVNATFPVPSSWDSKCQRCGRGTYIGAGTRPVEHDGGACQETT